MNDQAIAICRVSTPEQRLNNSLNRQEESVLRAAEQLNVELVKVFSGDASSKVGKNHKRKDLLTSYDFCKSHRRVKYLIVDEVDRFMRSTGEMFYWMTKFEQEVNVKVYFASNPDLNTNDAKARLLLSLDGFKAEGSNEERQHKSISGHEKAIREGRYTFPPKPGYMKGTEPGVHIHSPHTFSLIQTAFREVISRLYTPTEALKRLNNSSFTKYHAAWGMDRFRLFGIDPYYAGILAMDRQVKAHNNRGLHEPMLTLEEHETLVKIFSGHGKPRGPRKQYNPEFPMNKIMTCSDCGDAVKFTGSMKNNGHSKKHTTYYWKYHCRGCGKAYHRDEVHSIITERLGELSYTGSQQDDFIEALQAVWVQKQSDKIQDIRALDKKLLNLSNIKSELIIELSRSDDSLKSDIIEQIDRIKSDIAGLKVKRDEASNIEQDLIEFVKFGLGYTDLLMDDWWKLDHEERVRCQQLILPGGISFNSEKKVGTPIISPIYGLKPNKKDLSIGEKSLMVELAGTTPASDW